MERMRIAALYADAPAFEREFAARAGRAPWRIGRFEPGAGLIRLS